MTSHGDLKSVPAWRLSELIASTRHIINVVSRHIQEAVDPRYTQLTVNGVALLIREREAHQEFLLALLTEVERRNQNGETRQEGITA